MKDEDKARVEFAAGLAESLAARLANVGDAMAIMTGHKALNKERLDAEKIGRRLRQVLRAKPD